MKEEERKNRRTGEEGGGKEVEGEGEGGGEGKERGEGKGFILAHSFQEFSLWSFNPVVLNFN